MSFSMRRRDVLLSLGAVSATALLAACSDDAPKPAEQPATPAAPTASAPASQGTVDMAKLVEPGVLPEKMLGKADAPVTIVEYASMTCPHCATFTKDVFPKLKAAYIDSGKVRFVFREFPLDLTAAAGSMLARCIADGDANKYFAVVDLLFRQQDVWAVQNPTAPLKRVARQAGMGEQQFETCLKDQKLLDAIKESQDYAVKTLKINSTPTFFVNDTMVRGETSFEAFQKIIDPLLKG